MSTNYHIILGKRSRYRIFKSLHIGKSSGTLNFSFQGHIVSKGEKSASLGQGTDVTIFTPRLHLTSKHQWLRFLRWETNLEDAYIRNDYCRMELVEFEDLLEGRGDGVHFYASDFTGEVGVGNRWKDKEGYCFSGYEFS